MKKEIKETSFKVGQNVLVRNLKSNRGYIGQKGIIREIDEDEVLLYCVQLEGDEKDDLTCFKEKEIELISKKTPDKKPVVKVIGTKYLIQKGNYSLAAIKTDAGITIAKTPTNDKFKEFIFSNSKPEVIKTIGELLIKASEL